MGGGGLGVGAVGGEGGEGGESGGGERGASEGGASEGGGGECGEGGGGPQPSASRSAGCLRGNLTAGSARRVGSGGDRGAESSLIAGHAA